MKNISSIHQKRRILAAFLLLLIFAFASLFLGRYTLSPMQVLQVLAHKLSGNPEKSMAVNVVWDIRLPRVLLNIIVGAGLAAAGTAFQGIFQNRLVSPDILGVSNGAGFGAALAMLFVPSSPWMITLLAFSGGMISVLMTYSISKMKKDSSTLSLVLAGVIVGALCNALLSLVKLVADTDSVLPAITYWLMGSFASATFDKVLLAGIPVGLGLAVLMLMRWKINLLSLGDEEAYTLGVNPGKNRLVVVSACTLISAACVTVTGIIGWVGMVLPNMCREYLSADNKILLPASCIAGALFMVAVDLLARWVSPGEIPIGILTALVGAPFFILVYRKENGGAP